MRLACHHVGTGFLGVIADQRAAGEVDRGLEQAIDGVAGVAQAVQQVVADPLEAAARDVAPGSTTPVDSPLGLEWSRDLFSMSHVALPFPTSDPVYGSLAAENPDGPVALGLLSPRGERAVLTVPIDVLMRVTSNPFFPYLAERLTAWVNAGQ